MNRQAIALAADSAVTIGRELQGKLRMPPAMAAGVTDTLWTIDNTVRIVELIDAKPAIRGSYKKRVRTER